MLPQNITDGKSIGVHVASLLNCITSSEINIIWNECNEELAVDFVHLVRVRKQINEVRGTTQYRTDASCLHVLPESNQGHQLSTTVHEIDRLPKLPFFTGLP